MKKLLFLALLLTCMIPAFGATPGFPDLAWTNSTGTVRLTGSPSLTIVTNFDVNGVTTLADLAVILVAGTNTLPNTNYSSVTLSSPTNLASAVHVRMRVPIGLKNQLLFVQNDNSTNKWTMSNGQINLTGGGQTVLQGDFVANNPGQGLLLRFNGTDWNEVGRFNPNTNGITSDLFWYSYLAPNSDGTNSQGIGALQWLGTNMVRFSANNITNPLGVLALSVSIGAGTPDPAVLNSNNAAIFNIGDSAGSVMTILNSYDLYNLGRGAGSGFVATNMSDVFNIGKYAGWQANATNSADIYAHGSYAGSQMILQDAYYIFTYGDSSGNRAYVTNSLDVYFFGENAGKQSSIIDSTDIFNYGDLAGYQSATTNSSSIFNYGYQAGNQAASTYASFVFNSGHGVGAFSILTNVADVYNYGDNAGYQMNMVYAADLFNYGFESGKLMTGTNGNDIYNYGSDAGLSMAVTNSYDIYNYGNYAGSSMTTTNSYDLYNLGSTAGLQMIVKDSYELYNIGVDAGKNMTVRDSYGIFNIGNSAGNAMSATNSYNIYALGGLQNTFLTNSHDVVSIGQLAGNSISGSFTNVVLIGDGATATSGATDQVIIGSGASFLQGTNLILSSSAGYTAAGTKFLSDNGTYQTLVAGTTINPTDGFVPVRGNATTFTNSSIYVNNISSIAITNVALGGSIDLTANTGVGDNEIYSRAYNLRLSSDTGNIWLDPGHNLTFAFLVNGGKFVFPLNAGYLAPLHDDSYVLPNYVFAGQQTRTNGFSTQWWNGTNGSPSTMIASIRYDGQISNAVGYAFPDGTVQITAATNGSTINSLDGYIPARGSATTFTNSPFYVVSSNTVGYLSTIGTLTFKNTNSSSGAGLWLVESNAARISLTTSSGSGDVETSNYGLRLIGAASVSMQVGVKGLQFLPDTIYPYDASAPGAVSSNVVTLGSVNSPFKSLRVSNIVFSVDGTVQTTAATNGSTINTTDGYIPYRSNATTFGNSPWYVLGTNRLGFNYTNQFLYVGRTPGELGTMNIGFGAGTNINGTVTEQTAVGYQSLANALAGDSNTGLGYQTLFSMSNGVGNVAIGFAALSSLWGNSSFDNGNVAVGYNSMYILTNGTDNAALGDYAGYFRKGSENAGFGAYALNSGSGVFNGVTAVGAHAGENNDGSFNTFIGWSAGNTGSTSVTNAGAIGYNTKVTNDNEIVIGNSGNTVLRTTASNQVDLGSTTVPFKSLYLSTNSLYLGTNIFSDNGTSLLRNGVAIIAGGGTINPTDGYIPVRGSATEFTNSSLKQLSALFVGIHQQDSGANYDRLQIGYNPSLGYMIQGAVGGTNTELSPIRIRTATNGNLFFGVRDADKWLISGSTSSGDLMAATDGVPTIGQNGAGRPSQLWLTDSLQLSSTTNRYTDNGTSLLRNGVALSSSSGSFTNSTTAGTIMVSGVGTQSTNSPLTVLSSSQVSMAGNFITTGTITATNGFLAGSAGTYGLLSAGSIYADSTSVTSNRLFSLVPGGGITFTTNGPLLTISPNSASYASANMGTGVVTVATSASTNVISDFSYSLVNGGMSFQTNQTIVCTNAGNYQIEFGSLIGGANGDALKCMVFTNGVHCSIASLAFTCTAQAVNETGFKSFIIALPDSAGVDLRVSNANAASMTIQNTCLVVKRL